MHKSLSKILVLGLLLGACKTDAPAPKLASEHGRWMVTSATRSGRPTNTLDAAYFEFDTSKHIMTTNMVGEELRLGYSRDEEYFKMKGSALITLFKVDNLTDSTLALATEIRGTPFTFLLQPEVPVE